MAGIKQKLLLVFFSLLAAVLLLKICDIFLGVAQNNKHKKIYQNFLKSDGIYISKFKGLGNEEKYPRNKYISYVIWGYKDTKGKSVNIKNGFRKTYAPLARQVVRIK